MISVGNDIVDLRDPETLSAHPRFAERIGAEGGDVWFQFAAKEAAYKALRKIDGGIRPIPRRFVVRPGEGTVTCGLSTVRIASTCDDDLVHVVAWAGEAELISGVAPAGDDPGAEARRQLCLAVGERLGLDPRELRVERLPEPEAWDGRGPPRLLWRERHLAVDVSLSHHGRFVAWAAASRAQAPVSS